MNLEARIPLDGPALRWQPSARWWLLPWALALGAAALYVLPPGRALVNTGGAPLLWRFLSAALRPDLSPAFLWLTARATLSTLAFAVYGTAFGLLIGCAGGVLGSQAWWRGSRARVIAPVRVLLAAARSVHEVLWGLLLVNILGFNPLVAVLAIGLSFGAITAKVFSGNPR